MQFDENSAYSARAAHCCIQASLAKDDALKKYWAKLADSWTALDYAVMEKDVYGKRVPLQRHF